MDNIDNASIILLSQENKSCYPIKSINLSCYHKITGFKKKENSSNPGCPWLLYSFNLETFIISVYNVLQLYTAYCERGL